jgi:replicative DNA helicase
MSTSLPPPNDLDAEAAVLSALLLRPASIADVQQILSPGDFYANANRWIAEAIWALDAAASNVDTVAVASWLRDHERLQQVGGTPYLMQVTDATPAIAHVQDHARIVASLARIRRVQALCGEIRAEGYTANENVAEWLQGVEARVFAATQGTESESTLVTLRDLVSDAHQGLLEPDASPSGAGVQTKIPGLDRKLRGLDPGNVYLIAARPGHGKTALVEQLAVECAIRGGPVHFASLEMPREQLAVRALSQWSGVAHERIKDRKLWHADWEPVANAVDMLSRLPLTVDDAPVQGVHHVRSAVRRSMQRLAVQRMGMIVIDYFQLMLTKTTRNSNRDQELGEVSRGVRAMAKEFECPVLLLSQLNREIEKRKDKRPLLSDLRESGSLEADAFGIIFVYREDCYRDNDEQDGKAEIIVGKNRGGATGSVMCNYKAETMRFYEEHISDDCLPASFEDYA